MTYTLTKYSGVFRLIGGRLRPPHIYEWGSKEDALDYIRFTNSIPGSDCKLIKKPSWIYRKWLSYRTKVFENYCNKRFI